MTTQTTRDGAPGNLALWAVGTAVLVTAAYWALLGWDTEKDLDPATGSETGPYQVWQVAALVAALGLLAFAAGMADRAVLATVLVPPTLAANFVISSVAVAEDGSFWLVGAVLIVVGAAAGVAVVALLGRAAGRRRATR
jgi:hypothetical protein